METLILLGFRVAAVGSTTFWFLEAMVVSLFEEGALTFIILINFVLA